MPDRLHRIRHFIALAFAGAMALGCGLAEDQSNSGTTGTGRGGTGGSSTSTSTAGATTSGGGSDVTSSGSGGAPSTTTGNGGASGSATTSGTGGAGGSGTGGAGGMGGSAAGNAGRGGAAGSGGSGTTGGASGSGGAGGSSGTCVAGADGGTQRFSFFVTSLVAMRALSGSQNGFGGDLRFGKADGLSGGDEICRQTAERSMPGSSCKNWRAFLSVTKGPNGTPVNAIDRIGEGPWYDRRGRIVAMTKADLQQTRPRGADPAIINDLPNEDGVPNHAPDGAQVDNHDILTGSNTMGAVYNTDWSNTCHDWTSAMPADGKPRCGHSWPRGTQSWISILNEAGCAPGVNVVEMGGPNPNDPTVGSGGGYGAIYCFALIP